MRGVRARTLFRLNDSNGLLAQINLDLRFVRGEAPACRGRPALNRGGPDHSIRSREWPDGDRPWSMGIRAAAGLAGGPCGWWCRAGFGDFGSSGSGSVCPVFFLSSADAGRRGRAWEAFGGVRARRLAGGEGNQRVARADSSGVKEWAEMRRRGRPNTLASSAGSKARFGMQRMERDS